VNYIAEAEIATETADARAAFCLCRTWKARTSSACVCHKGLPQFDLRAAQNFRSFGSLSVPDTRLDVAENRKI
jgi:hypothetical protein